jgi:collagenase-like PrtC family protease
MYIPNKKELNNDVDAYLLGIENLSVNMPIYFTLEEIKNIKSDKEIFISLNKNMHSNDLSLLEETLIELSKLNIKGVFFYDIGVLNIVKRLNLNIKLVLSQEHLTTNYETINFWYNEGVEYAQIAEEIKEEEIINIKNNTKSKLIVPILGYFPMFVSRRHLKENYLRQFNLKDNSKINYIEKENKIYPIVDEKVTTVYTSSYLNGIREYLDFEKENIEYVLINGFLLKEENKIINMFKTVTNENVEEYNNEISNILDNNIDTFFLHKDTIYKVK